MGFAERLLTNGPFRRQTSFETTRNDPGFPSFHWAYGYGPGDVRIVMETDGQRRWTFRDPQDRVMREYLERGDVWNHERDFIYAPNGLLATRRHNGAVRYFHADHLGTPRLYTAEDGSVFSRHDYYPFGTEIEDTTPILTDSFESGDLRYWLESKHEPRVEYTGHERDANGLTDYMKARTYLYPFFRFGSIDPARDGWNPYTYVRNNPVAYVDPEGEKVTVPKSARKAINRGLTRSPEFTRLYRSLDADSRVDATLRYSDRAVTGTKATSNISIAKTPDGKLVRVEATILLPRKAFAAPELVGHELKHVVEILLTGKSLKDRMEEDGVWKNSAGFESNDAQDTEKQIEDELRGNSSLKVEEFNWSCHKRTCRLDVNQATGGEIPNEKPL